MSLTMTAWAWWILRSGRSARNGRRRRILAWRHVRYCLIVEQAWARRKATLAELLVASGAIS